MESLTRNFTTKTRSALLSFQRRSLQETRKLWNRWRIWIIRYFDRGRISGKEEGTFGKTKSVNHRNHMKNLVLILGGLLFILNTLAGLIISSFETSNILFTDISILLTTLLLHKIVTSQMDNGYKIGIGFFLCLSGFIRYFLALFSAEGFKDNWTLLIFLFLLLLIFHHYLIY